MSEIISRIKDKNGNMHSISPSGFFVCTNAYKSGDDTFFELQSNNNLDAINLYYGTTIWVHFKLLNYLNSDFLLASGNSYFKFIDNDSSNTFLPIFLNNDTSPYQDITVYRWDNWEYGWRNPLNKEPLDGKVLSFTYTEKDAFQLNAPSSTQIAYGICTEDPGTENIYITINESSINSLNILEGTHLYVKFQNDSMNSSASPYMLPSSTSSEKHYLRMKIAYEDWHPIVYNGYVIGTYLGAEDFGESPYVDSYYSTKEMGFSSGATKFWSANDIVHFIYLHNAWHILEVLDQGLANKTGQGYGWCETAAANSLKSAFINLFTDRGPGTIVSVQFSKGNTNTTPSLSINNGASYNIIGTKINWKAGDTVTFILHKYQGYLLWKVIAIDNPTISKTVFNTTSACLNATSTAAENTDYSLNLSNVLIDARII